MSAAPATLPDTPGQPAPNTSNSPKASANDETRPALPYWSEGSARPFLSGLAVAGLGYGRLALDAGYGKPHWIWAGVEGVGVITPDYTSMQAGLHLSAVLADLMVALRRSYAFSDTFMPVADSVGEGDLRQPNRPAARSTTIDATLSGFAPYRRFLLTWELTYVRPLGQSASTLLFEESQRVVISRDGLVTSKLGPMVRLMKSHELYAGILAEHFSLPGRSDSLVFRMGPSFWASLSDHWDLFGCLTWPVYGPDHLGLYDSTYGTIAVVYRFATQDRRSRLR